MFRPECSSPGILAVATSTADMVSVVGILLLSCKQWVRSYVQSLPTLLGVERGVHQGFVKRVLSQKEESKANWSNEATRAYQGPAAQNDHEVKNAWFLIQSSRDLARKGAIAKGSGCTRTSKNEGRK